MKEEGDVKEEHCSEDTTHTAFQRIQHIITGILSEISACMRALLLLTHHIRSYFHDNAQIFIQSSLSLSLCTLSGIIAGTVFSSMSEMLKLMPGLLILIPPANDMRGNVYGAMASRLGTSMHLGIFTPSLRDNVLYNNIKSTITLTLSFSVILGIIAKIFAGIFGIQSISVWFFIFISVLGGILSGIFLLGITVAISIFAYRRKLDIDNFSSPLITSAGDMTTIPSLYLAAHILLHLESRETIAMIISALSVTLSLILTYKGLRTEISRIIGESYPVLLICGIIGLLTGTLLESRLEYLISNPSVLAVIPPFLGVSGALGGILSARISSMLHVGMIKPGFLPDRRSIADFTLIYGLSSFFVLVGALSWLSTLFACIESGSLGEMIMITVIAGLLCVSFINIATYYIASLSFKAGLDPDNDTIPLVTSLTDMFGVFCILAALHIMT